MLPKQPALPEFFVGRRKELEWMHRILSSHDRWFSPFIIVGPPGIGKTALIAAYLDSHRRPWNRKSLAVTLEPGRSIEQFDDELSAALRRGRDEEFMELTVVVDARASLSTEELRRLNRRLLNYKRVRSVIVSARQELEFEGAPMLRLGPLATDESAELFYRLSNADLGPEIVDQIIARTDGNPALIELFAGIVRTSGPDALRQVFSGILYRATDILPRGKIVTVVKPQLITTTQQLIAELRRRPEAIYDLSSRKFEELLAEILADLGLEVELTQQTRDGGRDILAHIKTPFGKMLCLVEAKKYRRDRTIGVELVRQLYGTLGHYETNSAMMVTTSKYSPYAHAFQQSHKYVLDLREYSHVVEWIAGYKQNAKSGLMLPSSM